MLVWNEFDALQGQLPAVMVLVLVQIGVSLLTRPKNRSLN